MWFVYIVKCSDESLYTGATNDLDNRLQQHNHGKYGARYTRARRPVKLVFSEAHANKSSAMKRESEIKKLKRKQKLVLIASSEADY